MSDEEESLNFPNMDDVAYEVAIETIVKMYLDLRKAGLKSSDAASIVAAFIRGADEPSA